MKTASIFEAAQRAARRFWSLVDKAGPKKLHMRSRCWTWKASKFDDGYGKFWFAGRNHVAHRFAWLLDTGRWPTPMGLHRCDEPSCVRASHLFEGDAGDNARDAYAKGRRQGYVGDANPARRYPERVPKGERHPFVKFSDAQVNEMRARWARDEFPTQRALAKRYGISYPQLCNILNGKYRKGPTT